jgi:hypothetical protein
MRTLPFFGCGPILAGNSASAEIMQLDKGRPNVIVPRMKSSGLVHCKRFPAAILGVLSGWLFFTGSSVGASTNQLAAAIAHIDHARILKLGKDVMHWADWPAREPCLLFAFAETGDGKYLDLWKKLDPDPTDLEIRRNIAVTQPLLWMAQPGEIPLLKSSAE